MILGFATSCARQAVGVACFMLSLMRIEKLTSHGKLQQFVDYYYKTFDTNRMGLAPLYQEQSLLSFEGNRIQGVQAIMQKLTSLPFQQCQHSVSSLDAQPSLSNGIIVFVTGQLLVRNAESGRS